MAVLINPPISRSVTAKFISPVVTPSSDARSYTVVSDFSKIDLSTLFSNSERLFPDLSFIEFAMPKSDSRSSGTARILAPS